MSKSISAVMTPAEFSGTKPGVDSSVGGDEENTVPFSSLMKTPDAETPVTKSPDPAHSGEDEAQRPLAQAPAGLTVEAVAGGQEATELAGQLPVALQEVTEIAVQLPDSGQNAGEPAGQPLPAGTGAIQQTVLAVTPQVAEQDTVLPEQTAPARPAVVNADNAIAGQPPPVTENGAVVLANSINAGISNAAGSTPESVLQQQVQIAVQTTTVRIPVGDLPQHNTGGESVAAAVRAAVQLAVAQAGSEGLQQSLSEGRQFLPDLTGLAARTGIEAPAIAFADTLVETLPTPVSSRVQVPVGQQGWGRALGEQVVWYISQNVNAASLRLNPQHLGPLEMQVNMDGDKANVAFISQHATVREALDSAMPRLRELFAENGLSLGDVHVSQHGASGQRDQDGSASAQVADAATDAGGTDTTGTESGVQQGGATGLGLVDYYV